MQAPFNAKAQSLLFLRKFVRAEAQRRKKSRFSLRAHCAFAQDRIFQCFDYGRKSLFGRVAEARRPRTARRAVPTSVIFAGVKNIYLIAPLRPCVFALSLIRA
jgi:hypothetical protein